MSKLVIPHDLKEDYEMYLEALDKYQPTTVRALEMGKFLHLIERIGKLEADLAAMTEICQKSGVGPYKADYFLGQLTETGALRAKLARVGGAVTEEEYDKFFFTVNAVNCYYANRRDVSALIAARVKEGV